MNANEFTDYILSRMERAKLASAGRVINCRCPECGDSIHKTSAHFYINTPDGETPLLYYCHKCNCGGILNYNKLIEWDIYTPDVAQFVIDYNNATSKSRKYSSYNSRTVFRVNHLYTSINSKSEEKRKYICNRLGKDLSFNDLAQLKIVVNLNDLLIENRITNLTRKEFIVNQLSQEFIGFLSVDNAFLNMRRTCEEGIVYENIDKRYINYSIFDKKNTTQRFYTIPTRLNLNTSNRIKLHISEGPFDILSIFLNLRNMENGIYTCVAGNNYYSVIMYFLQELMIPNVELHFYTDNDRYGTIDRINSIINKIPDRTLPVFVHKNTYPNEKDFGVPAERIRESIMQLR